MAAGCMWRSRPSPAGTWPVNLRKFVISVAGLGELVRLGSITDRAARFLKASVVAGVNVVVSGGTQAESKEPF